MINLGHPPDDLSLRTLLNFRDRTPRALTEGLPSSSIVIIHTYRSRFIPEGVAETSQIFLRDAHVLQKLLSYEEYRRRDRW
jgi:hypothetical protein